MILFNFLVDFLLLLGVNRLAGTAPAPGRCALAAALGGLYAGGCLLPGFSFLGNLLWRCVSLGLMSGIAFGWRWSALGKCCLFVVLSMALGGIAMGLGKSSFGGLLLCAGGLLLLCVVGFRTDGQTKLLPVEVRLGGTAIRITALRDTGNTLKDPITGEAVLILGAKQAKELTGLSATQLRDPVETMLKKAVPGLRLIPYRTVNQPGGMLLAIRCDQVKIGGDQGGKLVALAPEDFPVQGGYQALTGGSYGTLDSISYGTAAAGNRLLHRWKRYSSATPKG